MRNAWGPAKMTSDAPPAGCLTRGTTSQDLPRSLLHEADFSLGRHLRKPRWTEGPSCGGALAGWTPACRASADGGRAPGWAGPCAERLPARLRSRHCSEAAAPAQTRCGSPAGLNLPAALLQGLLPTRPRSAPSALRGTPEEERLWDGVGWADCSRSGLVS